MHLELIGCTSAGKSSLAGGIAHAAKQRGIDAVLADQWLLQRHGLGMARGRLARALALDALAASAAARVWSRHRLFCAFAVRLIGRLPVPALERLNLARNVLKKVGFYEAVRRQRRRPGLVIVDEGTVQSAHQLFVHLAWAPTAAELGTFSEIVPLPDVVVYVREPSATLVERTLARGHARLLVGSRQSAATFVDRAVAAFERLRDQRPGSRMLVVDPERGDVVGPDGGDTLLRSAAELVRGGLAAGHRSNARTPSGFRIPAVLSRRAAYRHERRAP